MSLDVYLRDQDVQSSCACRECGNEHTRRRRETFWEWNITHNLNRMAGEAGIYEALWRPEEIGIAKAAQLIQPLREGLARLRSQPSHFQQFNPDNGWGDYDGLVRFVTGYLDACEQYPDAEVEASR